MLRAYIAWTNAKADAKRYFKRLATAEDGVTAIEYGLIAGAIVVVIIGIIFGIGGDIETIFEDVQSDIQAQRTT